MGRTHIQPILAGCVDPAVVNAPAWKNQSMRTILIDHGEFQIAI
jgi:hypothetical protein